MRTLSILLLVATLPACDRALTEPQRGTETVQIDRVAYVAEYLHALGTYRQYGFTIVATLSNVSGRTLYLQGSPMPAYSVQLVDGRPGEFSAYEESYSAVVPDPPLAFPAGEVRTDTIRVSGPNAWNGDTGQPLGTPEGTFRLRYWLGTCSDRVVSTCPASDSLAVSNPFAVVVNWLP